MEIWVEMMNLPPEKLPTLDVLLLGRRITCITIPALLEAISNVCREGRKLLVSSYNVHSFNLSMQLPWFYDFLKSVDIAPCDGMGIMGAIRYMGVALPLDYRASTTLLMPRLLEQCNDQGTALFLLGAKPEESKVAVQRVKHAYPNLVVGGHHGYFSHKDKDQRAAVIRHINQFRPQILIVGMGSPLQEAFLHHYRHELDANVLMTAGAVIDRLAGMVPDCPERLQNMGLEWFYRLCREPKRLSLRYLLGNPAFALHVALAKNLVTPKDLLDIRPSALITSL
ncbi:WecB/TagA/CpsF family glycosyltransferase [Anthocerotibacter panamensis]|uniref:WecB/TagA/CpsF family glycosyltransferase n=1 Tax=Anthocerotibacter panamensis TaxID=2857077 RepID=UPI001C403361|nr:WecB/TagA/CpsF family glycosyltransferase [Anthocerotibacter panamensis]